MGFIKQVMLKAPYVQLQPVVALSDNAFLLKSSEGFSMAAISRLRLLHVFLSVLWN